MWLVANTIHGYNLGWNRSLGRGDDERARINTSEEMFRIPTSVYWARSKIV